MSLFIEALQRARKHRRELAAIGIGHLAALLGNLAGVKILTRELQPAAYGELALGMTAAGLIFSVTYSPIASAMLRFYPEYAARNLLHNHVQVFRRIHLGLAAAVALPIALAAAISQVVHLSSWTWLLCLGGVYSVFNGLALVNSIYSTAVRDRRGIVAFQTIDSCGRPAFALLMILLFGRTGIYALSGYCIAGALNAAVQLAHVRNTPAFQTSNPSTGQAQQPALLHSIIIYASPMVLTSLFSSISSYGDRWTLLGILGPSSLGLYAVLCQIGTTPGSVVASVVAVFIGPIIFQRAGGIETKEQIASAMRLLGWAMVLVALSALPVVAIAALAGPQIVRLFASAQYVEQASMLWVIVLAGYVLAVGNLGLMAAEVMRRTGYLLIPAMVNAVATVSLSIALGKLYGIRGVIIALFLSNLAGAIACIAIARRLAALPPSGASAQGGQSTPGTE